MRGRWWSPGRVFLAGLLAASAASCSGPTLGVSNGSVSGCYRAIPVGRGALHDPKARLVGVHRIPLDRVRSRLPASLRSELAQENDTEVCAMAFHGAFAAGQVDHAPPDQHGSYALIVVSSRRLHLVDAVLLDHLPRSFGGRTF